MMQLRLLSQIKKNQPGAFGGLSNHSFKGKKSMRDVNSVALHSVSNLSARSGISHHPSVGSIEEYFKTSKRNEISSNLSYKMLKEIGEEASSK